ncbi:MAG: 30S ribosomal protein S12 methylthiotransferase RimO [Coprothermobacterota bacterium]|nr:30S ribosomal protein S12 methylthiotransferase RimO [Coprothermobacterota bacterium]
MRGIVGLINLGCPKNRVDGERILADYAQRGWVVGQPEEADLLIVNTCTFIEPATQESWAAIEDAVENHPSGRHRQVVVTGCLVQRDRTGLAEAFPEVHSFQDLSEVARLEARQAPRLVTTFPYAYLKIAEGCSRNCSFCLIPSLRGPFRSLPREYLLEEARGLRQAGIQEIVLVAQDATLWGIDLYGSPRYLDLVAEIADLGFPWVRLLYLFPQRVDRDFLRRLREIPAVVPYLDIPVQHIDDRILGLMKRPGGEAEVRRVLDVARTEWPEAALRTSLIAGFPSETDSEFQELYDFVEELRFDRLALFPFYAEGGAEAAHLPGQLPSDEVERRYDALWKLQERIYSEQNQHLVGSQIRVLADHPDPEEPGTLLCRSTRDAPEIDAWVRIQAQDDAALGCGGPRAQTNAEPGAYLTVRIIRGLVYDVVGELLKEA